MQKHTKDIGEEFVAQVKAEAEKMRGRK
jgi:hypothetical protein